MSDDDGRDEPVTVTMSVEQALSVCEFIQFPYTTGPNVERIARLAHDVIVDALNERDRGNLP